MSRGYTRGICTDCHQSRVLDVHRLCQTCSQVSLDVEDGESPSVLIHGRWVKRPGDAVLVWQEAS